MKGRVLLLRVKHTSEVWLTSVRYIWWQVVSTERLSTW